MRGDCIAEWILSLVVVRDRAASAVGDLMEDAVAHGPLWFWESVVRTALAFLWRSLAEAPLRLAGFAVAGWFAYMMASLILWLGGYVAVILLWGMGYFLTHHTGLELLSNILRIRFDWPPPPPAVTHWVEPLAIYVLAPLQVGRWAARCSPGREVAVCAAMALSWPALAILIPFVAVSVRVGLPMMPVIQACVLLGALWERRESADPTAVNSS